MSLYLQAIVNLSLSCGCSKNGNYWMSASLSCDYCCYGLTIPSCCLNYENYCYVTMSSNGYLSYDWSSTNYGNSIMNYWSSNYWMMNDYLMNESYCSNGFLNCVTNYCSNERNSRNYDCSNYVSYCYGTNSMNYDLNWNDCSNLILTMSYCYASFPPRSWKNLNCANSTQKNLSLNGSMSCDYWMNENWNLSCETSL